MSKFEQFLKEGTTLKVVAPDASTPADAKALFDKIWAKDKGGVLSAEGRKMYADLKKMGYWIRAAKGEYSLEKLDDKKNWVKKGGAYELQDRQGNRHA